MGIIEIDEDQLAQVAGGAAKTETRTATKEACEVCGRKKFTLYIGQGGRATCQKCGHGQIVLEWFNA
ncbi:MAG: hypothetical protein ACI4WX_05655 [Aristaeellaceae bacterium]